MKQLYLLLIAVLPLAAASTLFFESHKTSLHEGRNQPCPPETDVGCPLGTTCCHLVTGDAVCCQGENAVCCPNSLHCCPAGHKCDEGTGLCTRGDPHLTAMWTDMFFFICMFNFVNVTISGYTCQTGSGQCVRENEAISLITDKAVPVDNNVGSVVCPDGRSQCPDGNTCCKLASGQYGCCPQPNAVCCSDGVHCCPHGYTCQTGSGQCVRENEAISLITDKAVPVDNNVGSVVCPDGRSQCPDGNTCCKLASGQYGCCPQPNAVCCSDGVHCCPHGYTCQTGSGQCVRENEAISLITDKAVPVDNNVGSVVCPDGRSQCPDGNTCCKLASGQYGCCPQPNAVCCSDGVHCCPHGYTCQTGSGQCVRENEAISLITDKAVPVDNNVGSVVCPDGRSQCPDGNTCCKLASGQYGCCPQPNAVCCSDGVHCCPHGYTCQTGSGQCVRENEAISLITDKAVPVDNNVGSVVCPDGRSQCPDGNTCCKLASGQYGCCPQPNAVCCSDGVHCCPHGYTCQTGSGQCVRENEAISLITDKAVPVDNNVGSVVCPDGRSQCPDGNTCCKLASGQYGCCPQPNAVCCSDGVHCCPHGYTCQTGSGQCVRENEAISLITDKAVPVDNNVGSVVCPDGRSQCPDGNTCCKLASGQYGCCPQPNAVCCSDGVHCCPHGYTCQTGSGQCVRENEAISLITDKAVPVDNNVGSVVCPDGRSQCPDGNTCCKLASGQYGCCPQPNAVCCSDGVHCCPHGYTCQTGSGQCVRENEAISLITDKAVPVDNNVGSMVCPDGNTCCKLASGQYGCCPTPHAVCCSDGVHCCPNGYKCDASSGKCERQYSAIPWLTKTTALSVGNGGNTVLCPDSQSQCPDGNTCCKLASGEYGCCPIPHAVCCRDGVHCCPQGQICQEPSGKCVTPNSETPLLTSVPATFVSLKLQSVLCPDGISECPNGNTCCKLASGQYGCCPQPNAVCCSDGIHCCPHGTKCDLTAGTCHNGEQRVSWFVKTMARPNAQNVGSVMCPDGQSQCPNGNTCCKLTSGQYGCCPVPNAACCSDGIHCCPNGYTCQTGSGQCVRENAAISVITDKAVLVDNNVGSVICPDGQSQCPDGNTCCKLASGQYGCCPQPNAVCCSDGLHCCPNGYTCQTSTGECVNGPVICPDGQSQCPNGNTCCKLANGQYGCCPQPNAVCCSDGKHCCPHGYTCQVSTGDCVRQNTAMSVMKRSLKIALKPSGMTNNICPDGGSCPNDNTCCLLATGRYGCCPLPEAVCCSDHIHCCPEGYTCDLRTGTCSFGSDRMSWFTKTPAIVMGDNISPNKLLGSVNPSITKDIVSKDLDGGVTVGKACPGGTQQCDSYQTCCKMMDGQYGCCPVPNAVCCSDHQHCCPEGTTCDVSRQRCLRGAVSIPWLPKLAAKPIQPSPVGSVVCPDGRSMCPSGNTCCRHGSGYGCCPMSHAVCCSDGRHCCPSGEKCDLTHGLCTRRGILRLLFHKTPSSMTSMSTSMLEVDHDRPVPVQDSEPDITCDDQSVCPSRSTCCKLTSGQYGCCPLPEAVCCKDGTHCCPQGTECNTKTEQCGAKDIQFPWLKKMPATQPVRRKNNICPGGKSECPGGATCCKLASGSYGCWSLAVKL
ncbi:multiple epidermal growth factor-like domains protein 6 [Lingula anatina]|uniref:Multiple epidermal growth factor-like domains protein 6 n=1 Tax=Lingula anatina TaxID=7574 RepID=A0A2R2ML50_LINAN|nr:multiple epidermal growth factor-like domains protein 6 [Lingula anatina]|eukprot:XP_023930792.1 multiple epidermal growth factor-like domains protein 6 [Lingula anatina]